MSDELENKTTEEPVEDVPEKGEQRPRSPWGMVFIALLAMAALLISGMSYLQLRALAPQDGNLQAALAPLASTIDGLQKNLPALREQLQTIKQQQDNLQAQQSAMHLQMQKLAQEKSGDSADWTLAEIEYLLVLATHRLKLEHNARLALAALAAADDRLRNHHDPGLLAVRAQLTADMNALKAVQEVDISGLVLYLSDLVGRVNALPLQQLQIKAAPVVQAQETTNAGSWEKLKASIWQELRALVQVSRAGDDTPATLLPEQQYFLYQNLRLQLESARYAVLRRDSENLHVSAELIHSWLNDYFDVGNQAVANIIDSITQMQSLELDPELPDISSSLETLRAYEREGVNAMGDEAGINTPAPGP